MGRDLHCSAEVETIVAYLTASGVPFYITSTLRPGAVTQAGTPSLHALALACDVAYIRDTWDSEELARIFRVFEPVEGQLAELIYAGPQVSYNIKNGKRVRKYAQDIHHNHVHVAVRRGVLLSPHEHTPAPESNEPVNEKETIEDMAEPIDALCCPDGGVWVLTKDGGVRAYKEAPFHGSYPALEAQHREGGERTFVGIEPRDDGAKGYMIRSSGGELYRFP
jgi:hypothetical protein